MSLLTQRLSLLRPKFLEFWICVLFLALFTAAGIISAHLRNAIVAARDHDTHFFQHSGWHPSATIMVNRDGSIIAGCCPLCFTSAAPIMYIDSMGNTLSAKQLPDWFIKKGEEEIQRIKSTPQYLRVRHGFSGGDKGQREEQAKSSWDEFQKWKAEAEAEWVSSQKQSH